MRFPAPKKILLTFLQLLIVLPLLVGVAPPKSSAAELIALIRLDRQMPNNATGALVCATTPNTNTGTEASIQILFPQGFTVNATSSNWTVDTNDLPNGATAWPGIGTATTVSGQGVVFPSSDLITNTQYCFNFASSNTLTNPSSAGSFAGTIRTRNGSNTTLDSKDFAIAIASNNQIAVTATVPAQPNDFTAELELTDPPAPTAPIGPLKTLTYQITYESLLSYATTITIEGEWEDDYVDYVIGSASDGYNNTPPVIDTVNNKIIWTITNFPGNSAQTVTFQLQTGSAPAQNPVTFTTSGRLIGPGTQTSDTTVELNYQNAVLTPTPTNQPGSGGSGGSSGSPGSSGSSGTTGSTTTQTTSSTASQPLTITDVDIRSISATAASILVNTNINSQVRIIYGTNQQRLSATIFSSRNANSHLITLPNLQANTRYYFQIVASSGEESSRSDIYIFDTANAKAVPPQVIRTSLIIINGDLVLNELPMGVFPRIIIPINLPYSFRFSIQNFNEVKSIQAIIRHKNVLGINTYTDEPVSSTSVEVVEMSPGNYVGKLLSSPTEGDYELIFQIQDYSGNFVEQHVADIHVVEPIKIIDSSTKKGVEDAKVTFEFYNSRLKIYQNVTSALIPIKNPNFSEPDGRVWTTLPEGKYRITVETLGYKTKTVEFTLNAETQSYYPIVAIEKAPFNPIVYARYYLKSGLDTVDAFREFSHQFRNSFRFFDLIAFSIITLFITLLTVATSKRLAVPIRFLPYFFLYHTFSIFNKKRHSFIVHGKVVTMGGNEPVEGMVVYLGSPMGKIITHTSTNSLGEFFARIHADSDVRITISKKGFKNSTQVVRKENLEKRLLFTVAQIGKPKSFSFKNIMWYIEYILMTFFEAILVITVVIELLFVLEFGILKVLPFLLISFMNIVLWAIHMRAPKI